MLEDKQSDLIAEKRRKLIDQLIAEVSQSGYDLYYAPTSEVATYLLGYIEKTARLNADDRALLEGLNRRDIEIILSIKD
ncbi:MAG: hypothetical protein AAGA08_12755 [Pseudomonadota bacterium]